MHKLFSVFLIALSLFLTACGGTQPNEESSDTERVTINLTTRPDPAEVGEVELRLTVLDSKGQPINGADVDVVADHTDMSGMTLGGKATDQGNGVYAITANLSMAGNWEISVQVRKDALDYKQEIPFIVE